MPAGATAICPVTESITKSAVPESDHVIGLPSPRIVDACWIGVPGAALHATGIGVGGVSTITKGAGRISPLITATLLPPPACEAPILKACRRPQSAIGIPPGPTDSAPDTGSITKSDDPVVPPRTKVAGLPFPPVTEAVSINVPAGDRHDIGEIVGGVRTMVGGGGGAARIVPPTTTIVVVCAAANCGREQNASIIINP